MSFVYRSIIVSTNTHSFESTRACQNSLWSIWVETQGNADCQRLPMRKQSELGGGLDGQLVQLGASGRLTDNKVSRYLVIDFLSGQVDQESRSVISRSRGRFQI